MAPKNTDTFTDDNLKRFKEWIYILPGKGVMMPTEKEDLVALLVRFEASERVCEALRRYLVNQDHEDFDVALIAWKKSKGLA